MIPLNIGQYVQERHQEMIREAEAYRKARLVSDEREPGTYITLARITQEFAALAGEPQPQPARRNLRHVFSLFS